MTQRISRPLDLSTDHCWRAAAAQLMRPAYLNENQKWNLNKLRTTT
jgi:hypothetical protein